MQELTMSLNPKAKTPLYEQIYNYIKQDIQSGQIKAREKLPSSRSLASYLEVSRSTVDLAYAQLLSEGYLESIPCKGYFVCQMEGLYQLSTREEKTTFSGRMQEADSNHFREDLGHKKQGMFFSGKATGEYEFDFSPNGIDLDSFPYNAWRKINKNILLDDKKELFQLGDPKGEPKLRETICRYLHQARGVNCTPEQIVLGAGNDYLLLLLSAILGTEHKIAMETPTYKHAYRILEQLGISLCTVPMDEQGLRVDALRKSGANVAYVMPSHQYPLGIVMPIKRRLELLQWAAEEAGRYLIEDDYDSEFRYKGKPIPALQGSDTSGSVIYLGTFSKAIAPAIRISYLVLPKKLLTACEEKLRLFSSTVSRIDQMVLNSFMKEGYFERHLNRMRTIYGRKHEILLEELKVFSGICEISGEHAGVHLLLNFTNGITEEELVRRAADQGVKVYPLSAYRTGEFPAKHVQLQESAGANVLEQHEATVILGYATLREEEIVEAVRRLKRAWL